MVVSYLEAYRLLNAQKISWDQYIVNLFEHCKDMGHNDDDNNPPGHWDLRSEDPFGYSIWRWCKTVPTMKDATPFEDVFITYREGSADEVKQKLDALPKEHEKEMISILAFLALKDRRADVLKLCFEEGKFPYYTYWFQDEVDVVDPEKDLETFKVLEESHFRKVHPRKEDKEESPESPILTAREKELSDRARAFDKGGSHPVDW